MVEGIPLREKFEEAEVRRGGNSKDISQLTGGMKVRMVQWRVADRSCHELFDTE